MESQYVFGVFINFIDINLYGVELVLNMDMGIDKLIEVEFYLLLLLG